MTLSTHVLDTASGTPAAGVPVTVEVERDGEWIEVAAAVTDDDGRVADLLNGESTTAGPHRLRFDTGTWYAQRGETTFWLDVVIAFEVADPQAKLHVPLLLSPYGYSTYRGS